LTLRSVIFGLALLLIVLGVAMGLRPLFHLHLKSRQLPLGLNRCHN
jgi:hypothetical protein